jgi:diguanylate cyclase (GGDEF)-like protein
VTAPSLSLPTGTLAVAWQQLRALVPPRALAAAAPVVAVVALSQLVNGRQQLVMDPTLPLVIAVAAAGVIGGLRGGLLGAAVAVGYGLIFFSQPHSVDQPGNGLRVVLFALGVPLAGALAGSQRDRLERVVNGAGSVPGVVARLRAMSEALNAARPDTLPAAIVSHAATFAGADMAALTVIDLRTGRHTVRAVHGTSSAAVGVEVLPGVGLAGQAIRDHRSVVVGPLPQDATATAGTVLERITRWLDGGAARRPEPRTASRVPPAMAVPMLHAGSVVATLTLGRSSTNRPFTDAERQLVEVAAPQIGLAVVNALLRDQLRDASLRDPLTGLYNRAYLDAALDQVLALRRRTPPQERRALSLILFDIDSFRQLVEERGQAAGDGVLRAMAAMLRQRFRESDTIARCGGDGFVVVMDGADLKSATEAAGQIRAQLREMSLVDERGAPITVSVSAGCAVFRDEVARSEQIIRTVEAALDTARWSGPGSIVAI